jgi:hypothetical protein
MDPDPRATYEAALARLLDGEPEPGDGELVARALQEDPGLIREVSGAFALDDLLRQHAEPDRGAFRDAFAASVQTDSRDRPFVDRIASAVDARTRPVSRRAWLPWGLAAAAAIVALFGWWDPTRPSTTETTPVVAPVHDPFLAIMVNEAGARFAPGAAPEAVSFGAGDYTLTHGVAHVRFRNGTDVVFAAPATFTITDGFHVRLASGSLRALVPPAGHGFVVDTTQVRFRDLGTEFGVTVLADGSTSDLHVFAGQVEIYQAGTTAPVATLAGGESVRYVRGTAQPLEAAHGSHYPTPESIALTRWNRQRERLQEDPDLVFYHPFVPVPGSPAILRDTAARGFGVDGRIAGAEWVAGRWPGKQALQFEQPGDRVEFTIPGEYDQATLAAWVKVDRLENAANVLLASVGWRPGDIQWQLDRRGSPAPTGVYSSPKRRVVWSDARLPTGRWVHCAVTMDRITGRLVNYVNGVPAGESEVTPLTTRIEPGPCVLGSWIADNKAQEDRDFRGRIDELAMWRVALPPTRIARLAEDGMPVELLAGSPASPITGR